MKRTVHIAFMALATLVLVLLAIVPHHHHQGLWCNVTETCAVDHDVNDQHTHHHDDSSSCVEHLNYVATKYDVTRVQAQMVPHQFVAVLAFCVHCKLCVDDDAQSYPCRPAISYCGADIDNAHSLRAPPVA